MVSQFGLRSASEARANLLDGMDPESFLDGGKVPHLLDFYKLYFFEKEKRSLAAVRKMIQLESVCSINWTSHTSDHLPGYNFYVQTDQKLYILGSASALEVFKVVSRLKTALRYTKELETFSIRNGFRNAREILTAFKNYSTEKFYEAVENEFGLSDDGTPFTVSCFQRAFAKLKRYVRVLKLNEQLVPYLQEFVVMFHRRLAGNLKHARPELAEANLVQAYKAFSIYNYMLENYSIVDPSFKKLITSINSQMFQNLYHRVIQKISELMRKYFQDHEYANSLMKKNFYGVIFGVIQEEITTHQPHIRLNVDLVKRILDFANVEMFNQIIYNNDVGLKQLIHLLNSACLFNKDFFDFVSKIKEKFIDRKFLITLEKCIVIAQVNDLLHIIFAEIQIRLERSIIDFFNSSETFEKISLAGLMTDNFCKDCMRLKQNLLPNLFEILFNNLLAFILRQYFALLFLSLSDRENQLNVDKRLEQDEKTIKTFFSSFVTADNLNVQLDSFLQLRVLLSSDNYHNLLKASIKFNLFFNNQLQQDTISVVLEKNFNISLGIEEEILSFYAESDLSKIKRQSVNQSVASDPTKKFSRQIQPKKSLSNYLPYVSVRIMNKFKALAFKAKSRSVAKQDQESVHLSFDGDLVNHSVNENYLENLVKVFFFDSDGFDQEKFNQKYTAS